ncbi:MAG: acyl--CoA ligase [Acidimicrobiia bacterium]|nr:acyl--CoA ligase [Acidimicrobiia bacterium]
MPKARRTVPSRLDSLAGLLNEGPGTRILCEHRGTPFTAERIRKSRDACAAAMEKAGVGAGDVVAAVLGSKPNAIAALYATWKLRATFAPVDPHLSPHLARRHLDMIDPTVVLAGDGPTPVLPDGAGVVQPAGDDHLEWDVDSSASAGTPRRQVTALPTAETALRLGVLDAAGEIVTVPVTSDAIAQAVAAVPADLGGECRICTFPLESWPGLVEVFAALRGEHRILLCAPFSPGDFRRVVARHGIGVASLTTQMMAMLLEDPDVEDLGPLHTVRFASSHLPLPLVRRFHRRFGVNVVAGYGDRQFGREVMGWTAQDAAEFAKTKVGSVGRPRDGVEIHLGDESGTPLPEGRIGELTVQLAGERAVRTGEYAWLDPDGFVWIVGQSRDLVRVGTKQVFPESVEAVLVEHEDVRDAAVFGVPLTEDDTMLWAVIRPVPGAGTDHDRLAQAVLDDARARLSRPEIPSRIAVLDVLPKLETGLPDRDALASRAVAGQIPAISVID